MTTFMLDEHAIEVAARALYEAQHPVGAWDEAGIDVDERQAIHANYEMDAEAAIQAYLNEVRES